MARPKKTSETIQPTQSALQRTREALEKVLNKDDQDYEVELDPSKFKVVQPVLKTGSIIVDNFLGGSPNTYGVVPFPGIPKGRVMNLYGHESSGKTTLALTIAAQTIRDGGTVAYIDWEQEINPTYAETIGIPIGDKSKFMLTQPNTLEQGCKIAATAMAAGVSLIVLDSVGSAQPQKLKEQKIGDLGEPQRIGLANQFWSNAFFPKVKPILNKTGTVLLGISQTRANIQTTGYGGDTITVQGGNPWKFYSALRLRLQRIQTDKGKKFNPIKNEWEDAPVGMFVKIKADKIKFSNQQGNEEVIYIRFGQGVDNLRSIIEVAIRYGVVSKGGAWYVWHQPQGEDVKFQGVDKLQAFVASDAARTAAMFGQVQKKMQEAFSSSTQVAVADDIAAELAGELDGMFAEFD